MRINRKLKTSFNKVSRLYESARPEYPKSIYSYIKKLSKLKNKLVMFQEYLYKKENYIHEKEV